MQIRMGHRLFHGKGKPNMRSNSFMPYLLAAGMVTVLFLVTMVLCKLYPFGDKTLASSDAKSQYLNLYSYFRNIFFSNNDLNYSFSTVLGANIQGLYAYYLGSPLYLLFALFPERLILLALHLIIYLKLLIAAMTFCAWAGYRKKGNPWMRAALSVCYAFIGYGVTFYPLLSWLDAMALLPLVALGLERLVREHKPLAYMIGLAVTIMANYYVGFAVCLAAILIYSALLFVNPEGPIKGLKQTIFPFSASSLLAAALSAWILLPAVLALPGSRLQDTEKMLNFMRGNFPFLSFFSKFFTGTTSYDQFFNGLPTVFIGIIPLVLVILFFLNPSIRRLWKIAAAGVLLILFFSFHNSMLNIIWHGFTRNRMFNYRYSFIFSFFMLAIAWASVCHWRSLPSSAFMRCVAIVIPAVLLVFNTSYEYGSTATLYFDLFLIGSGLVLIFYATRDRRFTAGALVCLMAINCLANAKLSVSNISSRFDTVLQSERTNFLSETKKGLEMIPEDGTFYRVEKTFSQTNCDNMALNIPGVSNYSSVEQEASMDFIWKLGVSRYIAWGHFSGDNPVASESLLGIRYLLTKNDLRPGREDYSLIGTTDEEISVYYNPYALPMIMASTTLLPTLGEEDGFRFQNACWRSLQPEINQDIFTEVQQKTQISKDETTYLLTYEIPEAGNAYLHLPGNYADRERTFTAELLRQGRQESEILQISSFQPTYSLGNYEQGETLTLVVKLLSGSNTAELDNMRVYIEDREALTAYSQAVQSTPVQIQKITSSHLVVQCQVGTDSPYLVSTIPYDESWTVTVDGKKVQTVQNWNCMLAFAVESGNHTIELHYHPRGKTAGLVITLVSAVIATGGTVWATTKRKKRTG